MVLIDGISKNLQLYLLYHIAICVGVAVTRNKMRNKSKKYTYLKAPEFHDKTPKYLSIRLYSKLVAFSQVAPSLVSHG